MTSDAPFNVTLSIGDVSFHLTPSSRAEGDHRLSSSPLETHTNTSYSPDTAHRTRRPQQSKADGAGPGVGDAFYPSPLMVAIRRGSTAPPNNNDASATPAVGRVRAMKDVYEPQTRRRSASPQELSPCRASEHTLSGDYFVDLHSFTGTLHVTSLKHKSGATIHSPTVTTLHSPRKRIAESRHASDSCSKKRNKEYVWMPTGSENEADCTSQLNSNALKREVRFSVGQSSSNRQSNSSAQSTRSSSTRIPLKPKNENTNMSIPNAPQQEQQQQQPQKPKNARAKFPSPPRAALATTARESMNIARDTSSIVARHFLQQITLAGREAYDAVISGDRGDNGANTSSVTAGQGGKRSSARGPSNNTGGGGDVAYAAFDGTELHYACASDSLDLVRVLLEGDSLVHLHTPDCYGYLPLHLFAENRKLVEEDPVGCEDVAFTMIRVMGPDRVARALHPGGLAPFVHIIGNWTEELHRGAVAPAVSTADEENQAATASPATLSSSARRRSLTYRSLFSTGKAQLSSSDRQLMFLPANVMMPDYVHWAVQMLSRLMDEYPEQRDIILNSVASVPLLKSVLLIYDFDVMTDLLTTTLVRHAALDARSINVWLCAMLTEKREVQKRAVIFLNLISGLTLHDLAERCHSPDRYSEEEMERFMRLRKETFEAVHDMPGIVPAVLGLGGLTLERLSTTRVMRYITERTIRQESVFFVLICDFFYSIFLLLGYRLNVEFILYDQIHRGDDADTSTSILDNPIFHSAVAVSCYFLVKQLLTLLSLFLTSKKLAARYCHSVNNIIDVASVALLLFTRSALAYDPSLIDREGYAASITIILLWLKLMGAFKILNGAFALFLYAVHEVIREVKWFLLFLAAVTFMFSDAA